MLHRAVANRCIDAHRKKETMHRVVKQAVADGRFYAPYALAAMYDSDDSKYPIGVLDPKARRNFHRSGFVIERFPEDAIILRDLTDAIGEDYAQVVWLDYLDYDQQTAAELIGIEIGAYKTRLHRARARLKELYRAAMDIQDPKEG
jgi:DNA-directed RNA polymerase specialized sigma24 family protein